MGYLFISSCGTGTLVSISVSSFTGSSFFTVGVPDAAFTEGLSGVPTLLVEWDDPSAAFVFCAEFAFYDDETINPRQYHSFDDYRLHDPIMCLLAEFVYEGERMRVDVPSSFLEKIQCNFCVEKE